MSTRFGILSVVAFLISIAHSFAQSPQQSTKNYAEGKNGMVVCASPAAAEVGLNTLKKGGNAVDSAVAVAFAMAVTWPEAGNIGGGGFMHIWPGERSANMQKPVVIDYRETAPAQSTATMFIDKKANEYSHLSAGTPGTVQGLAMAHQKYGKLTWKELVDPAVKLASDGFIVNEALAKRINDVMKNKPEQKNAEFVRVYGKNGNREDQWKAGDILKLPDLAKTLERIRDLGPDGFYRGETAMLIEKEMKLGDGVMTAQDLADYKAIERPSISTTYRGHTVYAPPLPSGGGVILLETLNILGEFELVKQPRFSAETIHLISEATRRAFADRAKYMGDPVFNEDCNFLLTTEHSRKRAKTIDLNKASLSETLEDAVPLTNPKEGESTTHFSIVDQNGMAVSNTYTLENSFGSQIVVRGAGFILNNEMTDFNIQPGVTNQRGTVGTKPNQIVPGKRMLSSQCPTFVAKDGKLLLITGSPGGRTIPNTVLNIVINVVDYNMDIQKAVEAPRSHHQWFPDRIQIEKRINNQQLTETLKSMGHTVMYLNAQGDGHSIFIDPKTKTYHGAADKRLDGKANGY